VIHAPDPELRRRFEDVVESVYAPVQRYLRRRTEASEADDVMGDVLLVLWRRFADMPTERTLPWCYAVARRCLANHQRGKQRRTRLLERLAQSPPTPIADSFDPGLAVAMDLLSEHDREVLRLWAWEQLTASEIASVLEITPNAASIRLHRAIGRLKAHLERKKGPTGGQLQGQHATEATG